MKIYSILILYSEVMGYTMTCIKTLVDHYPVKVFLIGWDDKKQTPYLIEHVKNVEYRRRSEFISWREILKYSVDLNPDVIFVSGWMDLGYVRVARFFRKRNKTVVSFIDNPWTGSIRQRMGKIFSPWILKNRFTHLWVSGRNQEIFGRKMGYDDKVIFTGFYSADTNFFQQIYEKRKVKIKASGYPRNITFLGRFTESKGVDLLIDVFNRNSKRWKGWTLTLIGNGPLKHAFEMQSRTNYNIIVKDFIQPADMVDDILNTGIFCLPSRKEPWGVVIHEFAAAGVPLVSSSACGANTVFISEGKNGYSFISESKEDLELKLNQLMMMDTNKLMQMGVESYQLSHQITPDTWAATAMKIIRISE